jgi:hypothetical protein
MSEEFDSYKPATGFKDDFDGTIRMAKFVKGANNENYSFQPVIDADDGEEVESSYGVGSDWASYDGGATVEHPKGYEKGFHQSTAYSQWIVHALECGAEEVLRERNRAVEGRGAQYGSTWDKLRFHFEIMKVPVQRPVVKTVKAPDGTEREERVWESQETDRMFPTKFLGIAGDISASSSRTSSAPTTTTATTATPSSGTAAEAPATGSKSNVSILSDLKLHPLDIAKIRKMAEENSFNGFVDSVCALTLQDGTDTMSRPEIVQLLSDEDGLYKALRG